MFCSKCGAGVSSDALFCGECGARIEKKESPPGGLGGLSPIDTGGFSPTTDLPSQQMSNGMTPLKMVGMIGAVCLGLFCIYSVYDYFREEHVDARKMCSCYLDAHTAKKSKRDDAFDDCDDDFDKDFLKPYTKDDNLPKRDKGRRFYAKLGSCLQKDDKVGDVAKAHCKCVKKNFDPDDDDSVTDACEDEIEDMKDLRDDRYERRISNMALESCVYSDKRILKEVRKKRKEEKEKWEK